MNYNYYEAPKETLEKISILSRKIRVEEERAVAFYRKMEIELEPMKQAGDIDDFNLWSRLSIFFEDEAMLKKYGIEAGEAIEIHEYNVPIDPYMYDTDWRESQGALSYKIGYAMHCLWYHHHIDREDFHRISDVWIDVKVDYQFWTKKNKFLY